MKKYLIILSLSVIIIPSVTFASWWNPLSWKIFNRTSGPGTMKLQISTSTNKTETTIDQNIEIERLKKEVELLKRMNSGKKENSNTSEHKIIDTVYKINKSSENFNSSLLKAVSESLPSLINLRDYTISIRQSVDSRINYLDNLIKRTESSIEDPPLSYEYVMLDGSTMSQREMDQKLLKFYIGDRNYSKIQGDILDQYLNKYNPIISQINIYISQLPNLIIDKSEFDRQLSDLTTINNGIKIDFEKIKEIYTSFKSSSEEADKINKDSLDKLSRMLNNYVKTVDYNPPAIYVPNRLPSVTNCFVTSYSGGGTVNCYSY